MKVVNPTDDFSIETVIIRIRKEDEKENLKVGLIIVTPFQGKDNSIQNHQFVITKITDTTQRKGEIEHLGIVLEKMELTPESIKDIDESIRYSAKHSPDSVAMICSHCHNKIVPRDFGELILCPKCGRPYDLPF